VSRQTFRLHRTAFQPPGLKTARQCGQMLGGVLLYPVPFMLDIEVQEAVLGITGLKFSGRITMEPDGPGQLFPVFGEHLSSP
jgi:hypothetical protein